MKALVRKEIDEAWPGHALLAALAALFWWFAVTPEAFVSPNAGDLTDRHKLLAGLYLLAGLGSGFVHFAMERMHGTEAYLVHRGTGARGAFAAKLAAGLSMLAFAVVLPPLVYASAHVVAGTWIKDAPLWPFAQTWAASATALSGYAVGVLGAQIRGTWLRRLGLTFLGGASTFYVAVLASRPIETLQQASAAIFVLVQAVLAAAALVAARGMFRAGEDEARAWTPSTAAAFAMAAMALFTLPYVVAPASAQTALRSAVVAEGPQVVADSAGALYLAERRGERAWSIRDASGRPVPDELARAYDGYGREGSPFYSIYRPLSTPLSWLGPQDDALVPFPARAWLFAPTHRRVLTRAGDVWYDARAGRMASIVRDTVRARGRWVELDAPAGMGVSYAQGKPFGVRSAPLLVDASAGRLWSLEDGEGREPELVERFLPDGLRVLGVERVQSKARLRAGLYEPVMYSDGIAVVTERGPYLWDGERLGPVDEIDPTTRESGALESETAQRLWTLAPVDVGGLGFDLEVRDAATGEVRLETEYRGSAATALLMHASTLISAPAAAVASWLQPPIEARKADRAPGGPLHDPLLAGRARGGLLLAVLLFGTALALSTWRRLGRAGAPSLARLLWTAGTLAFGLSAWILARLFAPLRPAAAREASVRPVASARVEIVTA